MLEARGWSPISKHAGVTKTVSNQIRFYSCFTWKPRRRGWHKGNRSEWHNVPNREKEKTHQNQKKGGAVDMWCLTEQEKSQGGIQRLEGKIFRATPYKLRGIKWKTGQETSDPNKELLLEMLGQYFKEDVPSAESCDFSESATTMIEESTTTVQLRLHQQIL